MMRNILLLLSILLSASLLWAQPEGAIKTEIEPSIYGQLVVHTNPEAAWKAINENYGHVGNHHKGIKYAYEMEGQMPICYGTVRYSQINKTQSFQESITAYDKGNKKYTTTIYEATADALPILQQTVGIKVVDGQTYVYQEIAYKNATRQTIGKIKRWNRAYLKAYKEVIEEMMRKAPKSKQFQQRFASMLYEE